MFVCKCFHQIASTEKSCSKCGQLRSVKPKVPEKPQKKVSSESKGQTTSSKCPSQTCSERDTKGACVSPTPRTPPDGIECKELRIVLLGKTGAGKSATANTLLGQDVFLAKAKLKSVTQKCQYKLKERWGRKIMIVDTPGLFDTSKTREVIGTEIMKSIGISSPGPHAFLLVLSLLNRFTEEENKVLTELGDMFGENMMKYLIVVFTRRDQIDDVSVESYITDCPDQLQTFLKTTGGGYITLNNKGDAKEREGDARKLFDGIIEMGKQNGGSHFTSEIFRETEEIVNRRIARELEKKEQEIRREIAEELRMEMEKTMREDRKYFQKLHETNVEQMNKIKLELKAERERTGEGPTKEQESKIILRQLVHEEMERNEMKNNLLQQIPKTKGTERKYMVQQLADIEQQIDEIVAKRIATEEKVAGDMVSTAVVQHSQVIREEERLKIEKEEENIIASLKKSLDAFGSRFMNFFK